MYNNRIWIAGLLILINLTVFSNEKGSDLQKDSLKKGTGIINEVIDKEAGDNIQEGKAEGTAEAEPHSYAIEDDEELIYLDRLPDEEEEAKKAEKTGKIVRIINRIDSKVNPVLKFHVPSSYGSWYLIKTSSRLEALYENVRYNFKQEENGYRIVRSYYLPDNDIWGESSERGWIKESKGKVYLNTEDRLFKSFNNEIVYFDKGYRYMVIVYKSDRTARLFSKLPLNRIILTGEEKDKLESILEANRIIYDVVYNPENRNIKDGMYLDSKAQEERARVIEKQLMEDAEGFFKMD